MISPMIVQEIKVDLNKYRDSHGVLVHADKDGGDSCNRTMSAIVYFVALKQQFADTGNATVLQYLLDTRSLNVNGRYVRNPDKTRWYSNPDNFSRDQSIVLQSAMVVVGDKIGMWNLVKERAKRLFFHFNTQEGDDRPETKKVKFPDPPAPIEFAQFIRGLNLWFLYPILTVLDLQMVVDLLVTRPITKSQGNKDFDVQFLPIMLSALSKYPTPTGLLAKFIYSKQTNVESELRRYFAEGPGLNGLKPLGELAAHTYQRVIK